MCCMLNGTWNILYSIKYINIFNIIAMECIILMKNNICHMVDKSKLIANKLILFKQRILYVLITVDVVS